MTTPTPEDIDLAIATAMSDTSLSRIITPVQSQQEQFEQYRHFATFMNGQFAQAVLATTAYVDAKDEGYVLDAQGRVKPKKNRASRRAEGERSKKKGMMRL